MKGENKRNSDRLLCMKPASSLIRSNCCNEQGKQCSGRFSLCLTLCMFDCGQDYFGIFIPPGKDIEVLAFVLQ